MKFRSWVFQGNSTRLVAILGDFCNLAGATVLAFPGVFSA